MNTSLTSYYEKQNKKNERDKRVLGEANYYVNNNTNIRDVANNFMMSKSQVHVDLTKNLKILDYELFLQVKALLNYNRKVRVERMNKIKELRRIMGK